MLDWVRGEAVHATRRVDRGGYGRFRWWRLYAERGPARQQVAVWLTTDRLVIAFSDEPLAQYGVTYARDRRQLRTVVEERPFLTPFQSPQPLLWEPDEVEWLRVLRMPPSLPRRRRPPLEGLQLTLFELAG